jgi:hypothetical protein
VDSAGAAVLKIDSFPNSKERKFKISKVQIDRFRKALAHERFFDLADEYGDHVFDSSTTTMTISLGGTKKTVVLTYLMNWVRSDPAKLKEPSRAIRVLHVIREWFDDPEAVDLRKYERMEAEAAKSQQISELWYPFDFGRRWPPVTIIELTSRLVPRAAVSPHETDDHQPGGQSVRESHAAADEERALDHDPGPFPIGRADEQHQRAGAGRDCSDQSTQNGSSERSSQVSGFAGERQTEICGSGGRCGAHDQPDHVAQHQSEEIDSPKRLVGGRLERRDAPGGHHDNREHIRRHQAEKQSGERRKNDQPAMQIGLCDRGRHSATY